MSEELAKLQKKADPCYYPDCQANGEVSFPLEIVNPSKPNIGEQAQLPFCKYHWYIVSGGHFNVRKMFKDDKKDTWEWKIEGPFGMVEMTERVMAAREMARKEKEKKK